MTDSATPRVLVGVDDSPGSRDGVRFGAYEAERLGAVLEIIHVTPGYGEGTETFSAINDGTLESYGHTLLEQAQDEAQAAVPELPLQAHLISGSTVQTLVERGRNAAKLILGGERRSFLGRIWTGDVIAGVAARAVCPVVVVPPEWDPVQQQGRVVVGVKSVDASRDLISAGLALAHERGQELVVVHAWKLQSGYDDIIANRIDTEDYTRGVTSRLEPMIDDLRQSFAGVQVRIEVLHAQPAFALVDASIRADRVLTTRPVHGGRLHHLGAVNRALLQEARCPVEILVPDAEPSPES